MAKKAKFELSAGGLVYKKDDSQIKILLIKSFDRWSLPKGNVEREKKEKITETVRREIKEETGIKVEVEDKIGEINYMYKLKSELIYKKVYFYLAEATDPSTIKLNKDELQDAKWVNIDTVEDLIGYKNTKEIVKKGINLIKKYIK